MKKELLILAACFSGAAFAQSDDVATVHRSTAVQQVGQEMKASAYELVSFVANGMSGDGISLYWNTAAEVPNTTFIVERSSDRMNWRTAFTQDGEGNHSGYSAYKVMDMAPLPGISYYRLIATSNGHELEVSDDFAVEYNPVPSLRIKGDRDPGRFTVLGDGSISDVQLLNNRGQFMQMDLNYSGAQVFVRTEGLEPGTYFVQATVNGNPVLRTVLVTASGVIGG